MRNRIASAFRRIAVPLAAVLLLFAGLLAAAAEEPLSVSCGVSEDTEFGAVLLGCTIGEFTQTGFAPGDSCDVALSNGFHLEDVPVYDGYYGSTGSPLIVLYPSNAHPVFTYSITGDMWKTSGVGVGDTATVTLRETGRYTDIQNALSAVYSNDRNDYGSDEEFANFRELTGGQLRSGMFFRGVSPVNDRNLRAATADALIREAGVGFILDLADTYEKAAAYPLFEGSRFGALYAEGNVACLGLTTDFTHPAYAAALADGLRAMMRCGQPVYIHCTEGKDRTGFVCLLLEALAGADHEELLRDYMLTYRNYYGITESGTPEKYAAFVSVRFRDMIGYLTDVPEESDLSGQTFTGPVRAYLLRAGMTEAEIDALIRFLTAGE